MKKIIGILMIAMSFAVVVPAQAQIKFGIKGGLNLAKADFDESILKADNFTGFFVGPMAEVSIPVVGLGVDGALLFSQRGAKIKLDPTKTSTYAAEGTIKQNGLEIPVNLKYSIGLGNFAGVYLAAGPSFFFNLSGDDKIEGIGDIKTKNAQIGVNLGGGVKLLNHLQVGVNYNIPLNDSADVQNGSYKTNMWQISAAYLF